MLFLAVRSPTSFSSHYFTRILMAGSAPSNNRRYNNNRRFHPTIRASSSSSLLDQPQYPAHLYQWRLTHEPHEPHLHWNPRFRNQHQYQPEEPSPNWDQWFQQHQPPPPSILPYSQRNALHSQDQLYFPDQPRSPPAIPFPKRIKQHQQSPSTTNESIQHHHYEHNLPERRWSYTEYNRQMSKRHHHFHFDIACYNILAQSLLENNPSLYFNCQSKDLDWNQRKKLLLKELFKQNADIICLQEMQDDHYENDFRPKMVRHGYESIYLKRSGDKSDGCCLFFKSDRLRLVNSKSVPFYQENIPLLDRDNCGLIALFQPRSSKATENDLFCVATTHLLFSPKRGDIKLAQIQYFLAEIDRLATKNINSNEYYPIIVCGDLNAQPHSPLYQFLIGGHIKYDEYRRTEISGQIPASVAGGRFSLSLPSNELLPASFVTADCRFPAPLFSTETEILTTTTESSKDAIIFKAYLDRQASATLTHNKRFYSVYELDSSMPDVTSRVAHESNLVDYIFYTQQNSDTQQMNLIARYDLYKQNQMDQIRLPNSQFGSDHFLLAAKFALKLRKKNK